MKKCVIVVDQDLPIGLKANIPAVLSMSLGKRYSELVGADISDADEILHSGITTIPLPILQAQSSALHDLMKKAKEQQVDFVVSFNQAAMTTKDYESYSKKLREIKNNELVQYGVLLYGDSSVIKKLTSQYPLLK